MPTIGQRAVMPRRWIAVLLVTAVVVGGCGSDDASPSAGTAGAAPSSATSSAPGGGTDQPATGTTFPVTIEHSFGETVVPAPPERVVVAGLNEADYLYSLGIAPVGVHEWFGEYPYATGPWADPVRRELGAEPEVLQGFDVNVEWVASLDPDLIVVAYHDIDQTIYDQLSAIAPVVAAPTGPGVDVWSAPWRVQYRLIADAVGQRERAEGVIDDVDAEIERIKAEHPLLAGATFDTGGLVDGGNISTYSSGDLANQLLSELGMSVPEEFDALADGIYVEIAAERFDLLDELDTFIWLDDTGEMPAQAADIATFAATRLHREGREVLPSRDVVMAIAFNTPLSIPYYLDELAPLLDAALDGDPAT
jgi:iron complex transport system substrate-binding protein